MPAHIYAQPTPPKPSSTKLDATADKNARLALSAVLTDHAADLADRDDLIVTVAPGIRDTYHAPALIHFPTATIHIDAALFETGPNSARTIAPTNPHARPVATEPWSMRLRMPPIHGGRTGFLSTSTKQRSRRRT